MRARPDPPDALSLSFTDALTCAFGGAIALFLVFVAIVSLNSTELSNGDEVTERADARLRSIERFAPPGHATAILRLSAPPPTSPGLLASIGIQPKLDSLSGSIFPGGIDGNLPTTPIREWRLVEDPLPGRLTLTVAGAPPGSLLGVHLSIGGRCVNALLRVLAGRGDDSPLLEVRLDGGSLLHSLHELSQKDDC